MASDFIEENKIVLMHKNDVYKSVRLMKERKIKFGKFLFFPDAAIGLPYGSQFEIVGGSLMPLREEEIGEESSGLSQLMDIESAKNNRKIVDDGTSQKLTHEEIHEMKKKGLSGQEIMESVIHGSASFKDRTKFSQEKYVKKKVKRHRQILSIIKPNTRLIAQMYYDKGPSKICHLRLDMLSQILTLGNIHAHSKVVVMETCQGLLTGAVLERLGGYGQLVQVFYGDKPVRDALNSFGHLSERDKSILLQFPLHRINELLEEEKMEEDQHQSFPLQELEKETTVEESEGEEEEEDDKEEESSSDIEEASAAKRRRIGEASDINMTSDTGSKDEVKENRRKERELMHKTAAALLKGRGMDGLLIACRFHPEEIMMKLIQFLSPSRPVVVYCQFHEPLVQCYQRLKESGKAFNIQLSESWWRNYQVLSGRTHPAVNMDAQSGYLLHCTTLDT